MQALQRKLYFHMAECTDVPRHAMFTTTNTISGRDDETEETPTWIHEKIDKILSNYTSATSLCETRGETVASDANEGPISCQTTQYEGPIPQNEGLISCETTQ